MIQTYILFDCEATGLPTINCGPTKITEFSLISVSRNHFSDSQPGCIPRVLNKLTMCLHPGRFISNASQRISGLNNEMLEDRRQFDEGICELLENFIMGEPQPVCLLAHNGYRFDFPLLQAHTKILGKPLPDSVLCSDTLSAFRALKVCENPSPLQIPQEIIEPYSPPPIELDHAIFTSTDLCDLLDEFEDQCWADHNSLGLNEKDIYVTPSKRIPKLNAPPKRRESVPQGPPPHSAKPVSTAKRNLFGSGLSYKLVDVYRHLTQKDITNAHNAEADAFALLECISVIGPSFHDWVLSNHRKLSSIKKLW